MSINNIPFATEKTIFNEKRGLLRMECFQMRNDDMPAFRHNGKFVVHTPYPFCDDVDVLNVKTYDCSFSELEQVVHEISHMAFRLLMSTNGGVTQLAIDDGSIKNAFIAGMIEFTGSTDDGENKVKEYLDDINTYLRGEVFNLRVYDAIGFRKVYRNVLGASALEALCAELETSMPS